jgi:hypothetical protein
MSPDEMKRVRLPLQNGERHLVSKAFDTSAVDGNGRTSPFWPGAASNGGDICAPRHLANRDD